jgi:hypothetical protein
MSEIARLSGEVVQDPVTPQTLPNECTLQPTPAMSVQLPEARSKFQLAQAGRLPKQRAWHAAGDAIPIVTLPEPVRAQSFTPLKGSVSRNETSTGTDEVLVTAKLKVTIGEVDSCTLVGTIALYAYMVASTELCRSVSSRIFQRESG